MATSLFTSGLIFPIQIADGKAKIVTGVDLIKSSIIIILSWPTFTRYFQNLFGSRIMETLEEPNDNILISLAEGFVVDAINDWEPRITLTSKNIVRTSPTSLQINLTYLVKELGIQESLSYPLNY